MTNITPEDLRDLRAKREAATSGEWHVVYIAGHYGIHKVEKALEVMR